METKNLKASIAVDNGIVSFIASTAGLDRMGDSINQNGWDLDNYKSNPVILFSHDHSKPIGRAKSVYIKNGNLTADIEFAPEDVDPFAAKIGKMVKAGFLKAVSVGFRPLETKPIKSGYEYVRSELLEISVVSVPANAEALSFAKSFASNDELRRMFVASNQAEARKRQAVALHKLNMLKHSL